MEMQHESWNGNWNSTAASRCNTENLLAVLFVPDPDLCGNCQLGRLTGFDVGFLLRRYVVVPPLTAALDQVKSSQVRMAGGVEYQSSEGT